MRQSAQHTHEGTLYRMRQSRMKDVAEYLYFGYLPSRFKQLRYYTLIREIVDALPTSQFSRSSQEPREGAERWHQAIRDCLDAHADASQHIVPISGGLDSRAILAGLVAHGIGSQVVTVTFGAPGTYDFELGRLVAKRARVRHVAVELPQMPVAEELLLEEVSKQQACTWVFDQYYYSKVLRAVGEPGAVYWTGFLGGALGGSRLPERSSPDWPSAKRLFARKNRAVKSMTPIGACAEPELCLPHEPLFPPEVLGLDDQLDLFLRQGSYIGPTVCPDGFTYALPFLQPVWAHFVLSLPTFLRVGSALYEQVLLRYAPRLFRLPTKNHRGLGLGPSRCERARLRGKRLIARFLRAFRRRLGMAPRCPDPQWNYVDFAEQLRRRTSLRTAVQNLLDEYCERGLPAASTATKVWVRHQQREADHSDQLLLLAAAVVNIRARRLR